MKTFVLLLDNKYVKSFDGPPLGQSGANTGWYTEVSSQLGTIEFTDDINLAYKISGRINLKSTFDRLITRMSEQGLEFSDFRLKELEEE